LDSLGKKIAVLGACAAALVFVIQFIALFVNSNVNFESVQEIFITCIVLIVASVPEGLPTIVAVSLALNVIKMAKQNALVKKMVACETVGSISIICSDKTGTLTENKMTVSHICTANGKIEPGDLTDAHIIKNFCVNSTANISKNEDGTYSFIGSPTECAMLAAYDRTKSKKTYAEVRAEAKPVHVYQFSSELKRMTTVFDEGGRLTAYSKGAPEIVLEMCEMDSAVKRKLLKQIESFQSQAKRVIGLAHGAVKRVDFEKERNKIESGLSFDGFAVISDPIRTEVYAAVNECRAAGVKIMMLTGDNIVTARAIAKELGIITDESEVFHAGQIEKMSDDELERNVAHIRIVARSTPMTKLRIVKTLKKLGEVVAVTGDGINDAPAIKQADVGISMGITGTEVSKEASDIVLLDDSFSTIVKSVQWGRGIYENFQRFIMFQLTVNLSAVLVTVVCIIMGMEAPFNALQLLWINLIMDGPPALTLGLEPMRGDLMKRKPVERGASLVTRRMFIRIAVNGLYIALMLILQAKTTFLGISGEREKTALFTLFVVFQLFNAFNARELGNDSAFATLLKNKPMLIVMLITFGLQLLITQVGTVVFNTVPLGLFDWLKILATGLSLVVFNELYKLGIGLYKRVRKGLIKR
jgi:Ca2+-transporting ATPase